MRYEPSTINNPLINELSYGLSRPPPAPDHCSFKITDSWHCCQRTLASLVPRLVIWHACWLNFGVLGACRLLAWWLGNILISLLACWVVGFRCLLFYFGRSLCWSVCWLVGFWMLVPMHFFCICSCVATALDSCALLEDFRF